MVKERKGKVLRCEQVLGGHGPVQRMAYDLACRGVKEHCIAKAHSTMLLASKALCPSSYSNTTLFPTPLLCCSVLPTRQTPKSL